MNIGAFDRVIRLGGGLGVVLFDYVSSASWKLSSAIRSLECYNFCIWMVPVLQDTRFQYLPNKFR